MQVFLSKLKLDIIADRGAEHIEHEKFEQLDPLEGNTLPQHFAPLRAKSIFDIDNADVTTACGLALCVALMVTFASLFKVHA